MSHTCRPTLIISSNSNIGYLLGMLLVGKFFDKFKTYFNFSVFLVMCYKSLNILFLTDSSIIILFIEKYLTKYKNLSFFVIFLRRKKVI